MRDVTIDLRLWPEFPGEGVGGLGDWNPQGKLWEAGPYGNHDIPHVWELLWVQEGRQLLPTGHRVPILVSHPETPLIPSQHLPVGLCILQVMKFFTWKRRELGKMCFPGGTTRQVEEKDKKI